MSESSRTARVKSGCRTLYVHTSESTCRVTVSGCAPQRGEPEGTCVDAWAGALGELAEYCRELGGNLEEIARRLRGHRCHRPRVGGAISCPDAVGRVLCGGYDAPANP